MWMDDDKLQVYLLQHHRGAIYQKPPIDYPQPRQHAPQQLASMFSMLNATCGHQGSQWRRKNKNRNR